MLANTGDFTMHPLILYTTSGCHLCEHAEAILEAGGHVFQPQDIADDLELMERYGVRIPVVRDRAGRELGWPFDGTQLEAFLSGALP
jgi:glutaredoxin|tara:strand:- start:1144 stop:1404 length:261 start_codon:yes stop_codon:yes gene_type:complete